MTAKRDRGIKKYVRRMNREARKAFARDQGTPGEVERDGVQRGWVMAKRKPAPKRPQKRGTRPTLTERQRRFVREYLASGNATEAARRAGYAHPNKQGPIAEAIAAGGRKAEEHVWLTREERLVLLSGIAAGKVTETTLTLSGDPVEGPAKLRDRIKAMELMGRMCGDFSETRKHEGEIAVTKGDAVALLRERLQADPGVRARLLEVMGGGDAG